MNTTFYNLRRCFKPILPLKLSFIYPCLHSSSFLVFLHSNVGISKNTGKKHSYIWRGQQVKEKKTVHDKIRENIFLSMLILCLPISNHESELNKPFLSTITLQGKLRAAETVPISMCLCAIRLIILHSFYWVRAVRVPACLQNDNVKYSRCWRQSEPTAISNSAYPVTWDFYFNQSTTVFRQFRYRCLNSKSSFRINIKTKCYDSKVNDPRSLWLYLLTYLL